MSRLLCALGALALTTALSAAPVLAAPAGSAIDSPAPLDADTVPSPADERSVLIIDAGRLVVMMDQSRAALDLLRPGDGGKGAQAAGAAQRAYAFQELVSAVLHYNLLQARACRAGIAAPGRCTGPYRPAWLDDPPDKDHSEAELRAMVEAASRRLVPFWSDVCGKGAAIARDEGYCDLE